MNAARGQTLVDAVAAPRFHRNGRMLHFQEPTTNLVDTLRAYGYEDVGGRPGAAADVAGVTYRVTGGRTPCP